MKLPPYGVCLPCEITEVIDGDTMEVRLRWSLVPHRVRLLDCWAAERGTDEGRAAKHHLETLVEQCGSASVYVPLPDDCDSLSDLQSLGRWLGRVFLGHCDVSEMMVSAGHATAKKGG